MRQKATITGLVLPLLLALGLPSAGAQDVAQAHVLPDAPRADAEPFVELSVAALIERMAATDPDVARARLDRQEREIRARQAMAVLGTALSAQANVNRSRQLVDSGISSGTSINERYALQFGVSQRLAAGTTLGVTLEQGLSRSVFPLSTEFFSTDIENGPNVESALTLSLAQPLLRGRGRDVVLFGLLVAEQQVEALEPEAAERAANALLEALGSYVELEHAWRAWEAAEASLERAVAQRDAARTLAEGGRAASIDVDIAEQRVLVGVESLLVAQEAVRVASRTLEARAGESGLALRPLDALAIEAPPASCDAAWQGSASLQVLRASRETAVLQLTQSRDGLRPSLDLTAGVSASGLDPGYATAVAQMATLDARSFFAGLVFSMPLGNLAARSEHELAQVAVDRVDYEIEEAERALCREYEAALAAASLVESRLAVARERAALARRTVDAQAALYAGGYSTVQAGLDALEQLDAAELELLRLEADLRLARLRAAWMNGSILGLGAPLVEAM